MTTDLIRFRFKGSAYDGHTIDVNDLAPALIALGDLCTITNRLFNGDRVHINVLIKADVEQKCFELGVQLVQSVYDQLKGLVNDGDVATIKSILEWVGIISVSTGGPFVGYLQFMKWVDGRKINSLKQTKQDSIQITVVGNDNNVTLISPQVAKMIGEPKLLEAAKSLSAGIQKEGSDELEFEYKNKVTERITKQDAARINANTKESLSFEIAATEEAQTIKSWIKVYSPVYDASAPKWRFRYGSNIEYMDITETSIAADAIARGGSMVDDTYC